MIAAIRALEPGARSAQEDALVEAFPRLPGWSGSRTVLLYVSAFPEEIRTERLLSLACEASRRLVLPRVDLAERRLRLHPVSDPRSDLEPGILGIPEPLPGLSEVAPDEVDWALVPGLAFDESGYRLGRGAGLYDRLLPIMRPDCICWSIGFACQLVPALPVERHDIPIDGVSTPDRTIRGVGKSGRIVDLRHPDSSPSR
jgi:5-formyltetrahydrofolate cyclo-ligase